ncbi:MAG: LytR/AlgR family response regulator transcription factor [Prevotella sp.]|jgi:two-component system LytT family response regulator
MIRTLAIDDEPLALQQLAAYIKKVPFLELVAECHSAMEAKKILDKEMIDCIFCDINMPDLDGMSFVKSLAAPPAVVFTTAYSEYAVEGYKVDAVDYLLKPYSFDEFRRAAEKVQRVLTPNPQLDENAVFASSSLTGTAPQGTQSLFIKSDGRILKILIKDIRYVEGMSEYLKIHLKSQPRPIVTLLSMKKLEERLPSNFMRIHRSYIINLDEIQEVNKNRVILDENTFLPIGDLYKDAFLNYISSRFLGK